MLPIKALKAVFNLFPRIIERIKMMTSLMIQIKSIFKKTANSNNKLLFLELGILI